MNPAPPPLPPELPADPPPDLDPILRRIKQGFGAAIISSVFTFLKFVAAMSSQGDYAPEFADPWVLADVLIFAGLGIGVYKKSRVCAVLVLCYFLTAKVLQLLETGNPAFIIGGLIFAYFYVQGLIGTVQYHRATRHLRRRGSVAKRWLIGFAIGLPSLVLILLLGLGIVVEAGLLPDTVIQRGDELSDFERREIASLGVIPDGENVLYFYSADFFSVKGDGNVLTENYVISYESFDGEFWHNIAALSEIADMEFEPATSFWEDGVLTIYLDSGEDFLLWLSGEEGRDQEFWQELQTRWRTARGN